MSQGGEMSSIYRDLNLGQVHHGRVRDSDQRCEGMEHVTVPVVASEMRSRMIFEHYSKLTIVQVHHGPAVSTKM